MSTPYPPARQCGLALAMLMVGGAISFLDRQILSLLIIPIQHDLKIGDTQISFLLGFAFVGTYAVAGLPIGRAADRLPRFQIISIGIGVWNLMTALCASAGGYWHLFLLRMGVGVGEASLNPAAYSLMPDLFPPRRLGLAPGLFTLGIFVGSGLAMVIGAQVIGLLSARPYVEVPILGPMRPWQLTFLLVGAPGLLVATWAAFIPEPARRGAASDRTPPLADVLGYLRSHSPAIGGLVMAWAFASIVTYAGAAWIPTFLIRTYGWTARLAGMGYGVTLLVSGGVGIVSGGMISDRILARHANGRLALLVGASLLAVPGLALFPSMNNGWAALALAGVGSFLVTFGGGGLAPGLQEAVPNRMRGLTTALALMTINLVGLGAGPTSVALVTDYVLRNPAHIRYSLAIVLPVSVLVSIAIALFAARHYPRTRAAASRWTEVGAPVEGDATPGQLVAPGAVAIDS